MTRSIRILSIFAIVSGCALLLSACGGGSIKPTATNITANADIPDSVYAGSTATVSVALAASTNSWGTAKVQLVDVGTVTPQIDCGPAQRLTIRGNSGDFACQAPQANLGSSNEHDLQIEVNGKPNLSSPVPVQVVNGGRVYATLTSTSGAPIEAADPGETFDVLFSADTSRRVVAGQYSVAAPSGWQVGGNNGACTIDVNSPSSCKVPVTVPAAASAATYGLELDKAEGSSRLSPYLLAVTVEGLSLGAPIGGDNDDHLKFYVAQNISDTLYTGSQFHYYPVFLFENLSNRTVTISAISSNTVPALTNVKAGIVTAPLSATGYYPTLSATEKVYHLHPYRTSKELYAVTGSLATGSSMHTTSVEVTIKNTLNKHHYTNVYHPADVTFVPYVKDHIAVRIVPPASGSALYAAAIMEKWTGSNTYMVTFDKNYVGTISTDSEHSDFNNDQFELSKANNLFYMPHGQSGVIYLARGKFSTLAGNLPSHVNVPNPPRWLRLELTYGINMHPKKGPPPAPDQNEQLYVDQSYVNAISVMARFNVMGQIGPLKLDAQNNTRGITSHYFNLDSRQLFRAIKKGFDDKSYGAVWNFVCSRQDGLQNYVREGFKPKNCRQGPVLDIFAPITLGGVPVQSYDYHSYCVDPMRKGEVDKTTGNCHYTTTDFQYYESYIDPLWKYLQKHPIYVKTTFAQTFNDKGEKVGIPNCIVRGVVEKKGEKHAGYLVFTQFSKGSTCPTDVTGGTVTSASPLLIAKFKACDFLQAAGSSTCNTEGLYGTSGSYRAAVGEVLASFQATGLLPLCPDTIKKYRRQINKYKKNGKQYMVMDRETARAIVTRGGAYQNPTCLEGVSKRSKPFWNVYAAILGDYDDVYNYSYGDFLGLSGTVEFAPPSASSDTWFVNLGKVAQPVTVTIK